MIPEKLKLNIIGYDRIIYQGEADFVVLPTEWGELGVLPGHTRLFALLRPGKIRVKNHGADESYPVKNGVIKIKPDEVEVLSQ
ncbi:MAG: ATP synthase F1 subunit epsilon [Candidatus Omnitrophica bacterium]|nr:ATP synthase F1 subunit epsilon [Candidatus Omnitrophota bacterium]